ncbi:hypothetical protein TSAR_015879 [Trichomalopsis sarcophagae]|uniref:Uncharacterized protein n=1 Tax=Trichomalopsis sarcophagae TaxID=543379 RepID=A0A232FIJ8_9HYME|nr:hypothetical protein TSAR_015879 [Trichomalopsis sarcophagae]
MNNEQLRDKVSPRGKKQKERRTVVYNQVSRLQLSAWAFCLKVVLDFGQLPWSQPAHAMRVYRYALAVHRSAESRAEIFPSNAWGSWDASYTSNRYTNVTLPIEVGYYTINYKSILHKNIKLICNLSNHQGQQIQTTVTCSMFTLTEQANSFIQTEQSNSRHAD